MDKKIMILGDTHGNWGSLNALISKKHPEIILQCGDFGYWPHMHMNKEFNNEGLRMKPWDQWNIKNQGAKIYWADGNHENHNALDNLIYHYGRVPIKMNKFENGDVYFMPRSSHITLPDGRVVLFMGGGYSIDKKYRTENIDWWRQEVIGKEDIDALPDIDVDIVISHTCPRSFFPDMKIEIFLGKDKDQSCDYLDVVFDKYKPDMWFFGHFHKYMSGRKENCYWTALNMTHGYKHWMWLPEMGDVEYE